MALMTPHSDEIIVNEDTKNAELCYEDNIELLRQYKNFLKSLFFLILYEILEAKIDVLEPEWFSSLRNQDKMEFMNSFKIIENIEFANK